MYMPAISWNEIKRRAVEFAKEYENETREHAEAKSFWDAFFYVFGLTRRRLASFEEPVKLLNQKHGFIDLFWKGRLLVEHKSAGKDLDSAYGQALDYFAGIPEKDLPQYVLVSDFQRFRLYDLEEKTQVDFALQDLPLHIETLGFIAGYEKQVYKEQDDVNLKAVELMDKVYLSMQNSGYDGHVLTILLVRILFCLFAEDTGIFKQHQFLNYIELNTKQDGSDLGMHLNAIFQALNTPQDKRQDALEKDLRDFDYVNGGLFEENLPIAAFDSDTRKMLISCGEFDWSKISPAIFGSLFQGVMDKGERRHLGAHYTSEKNILKVIKPLFLDALWEEFEKAKTSEKRLQDFHKKLGTLKFLDPACGCGNFLVIAYREIKLLEIEVIDRLYGKNILPFEVENLSLVKLKNFFGIEIEEFPARIAQTALWLMQHQMNREAETRLGKYTPSIPLTDAANITIGDALELDWEAVVPKTELSYIFGNPPFVGSKLMSEQQRGQVVKLFSGKPGSGTLDFVSAWYAKSAQYIQDTRISVALVSTNSITQGEQVSVLWEELLKNYGVKIHFAHRTFKWFNEAKGKAAVYCVIIGFGAFDTADKKIFDYTDVKGEAHEISVKNINPYLVEAGDVVVSSRHKPLCAVPEISFGNMPLDGGHLLLSDEEKQEFVRNEPGAQKFIRPLVSAKEFLNGQKRWCLWLVHAEPGELKPLPLVLERVEQVRKFRLSSKAPSTQKFASTPSLFRDRNNPDTFILIPSTTSENRKYIPMGFFTKEYIANNSCHIIPNATLYHFGVLESEMHMAWVRHVCGRLESRFRYSKDIVYNNFPWPEGVSKEKKQAIEDAAQKVLDTRARFPASSLAELYDPLTMPKDLVDAHASLDRAVDSAYGKRSFTSDTDRLAFLFDLYTQLTKGLPFWFLKICYTGTTNNFILAECTTYITAG